MNDTHIRDLQLELLQEFFKIQMFRKHGQHWARTVAEYVESLFALDEGEHFRHNYQGVFDRIQFGTDILSEKDMDVTAITSCLQYKYKSDCIVGSNREFTNNIRAIKESRNKLVGHQSNPEDILTSLTLQLNVLKSLRIFLDYLRVSDWDYSGKNDFIDKYQKKISHAMTIIKNACTEEDSEVIDVTSNVLQHLNDLINIRSDNLKEYIPLSYKRDDSFSKRFLLADLLSNEDNKSGFILVSKEAGYGKTWSLQEVAGIYAEEALNDLSKTPIPVFLKMGELSVSNEPIMKAIQGILYPDDRDNNRTESFIQKKELLIFVDGMDEAKQENKDTAKRELSRIVSNNNKVRVIGGTRESDSKWYPSELSRYYVCSLSDKQVEQYIDKVLTDPNQKEAALFDYFKNPKTSFLRCLNSPFYMKCFIGFIQEDETMPDSDTDMMNRYISKIINREISKGFNATENLINDYLNLLSDYIGNDNVYVNEREAIKFIKEQLELEYDLDNFASAVQIKDTLVEMLILKEAKHKNNPTLLAFWHEKYKSLFSSIAKDISIWEDE